jgi:hypothetical protein
MIIENTFSPADPVTKIYLDSVNNHNFGNRYLSSLLQESAELKQQLVPDYHIDDK